MALGGVATGVKLYRYVSPDFDRSQLKGVMIDPVVLYQTALKKEGQKGLSEETIYQTPQPDRHGAKRTRCQTLQCRESAGPRRWSPERGIDRRRD